MKINELQNSINKLQKELNSKLTKEYNRSILVQDFVKDEIRRYKKDNDASRLTSILKILNQNNNL